MKETNARALIADALLEMERNQVYPSAALSGLFKKNPSLDERDRAFCKRTLNGTVQYLLRIDHILGQFSKTPVKKLKPYVRAVFRMSVYQLIWMDSVPDSAVCNEAVKLVSARGLSGLKGFVNGVLRNISRNKDNISYPDPDKDLSGYLSIFYSCPEWIVSRFEESFGPDVTAEMLKDSLKSKPLSVRLRTAGAETDALLKSWESAGLKFSPNPYIENAFMIEDSGTVELIPGFKEGKFTVQDTGSMFVALLGCAGTEMRVLDLCAAPGGKSMHAADILCKPHLTPTDAAAADSEPASDTGSTASAETADAAGSAFGADHGQPFDGEDSAHNLPMITCLDISPERCVRIQENIDRLNLSGMIETGAADATVFVPEYKECADLVIADVPCSGLGVIGHKPDIKYRRTPEDIKSLSALQRQIIDNAVQYVKPGGRLVYSTCTVAYEENEAQAEYIMDRYGFKDITAEAVDRVLSGKCPDDATDSAKPGLLMLPGIWQSDGFYICVLSKE